MRRVFSRFQNISLPLRLFTPCVLSVVSRRFRKMGMIAAVAQLPTCRIDIPASASSDRNGQVVLDQDLLELFQARLRALPEGKVWIGVIGDEIDFTGYPPKFSAELLCCFR